MSDRIAVFNQGSCVQCDTPERLYLHPRTRFVAEFFHGCNVLYAKTCGGSAVSLAGVMVPLSGVGWAEKGTALHLALRAESVKLEEPAKPGKLQLPARLVSCTFRGMLFDHVLELADGQLLTASTTQRASCHPGDVTRAQIDPADLLPLED